MHAVTLIASGLAVGACAARMPKTADRPPATEYPVPAAVAPLRPTASSPPVIAHACPVDARGVVVTVEETPLGGALRFSTSEDPSAMRTQLFAIADVHNSLNASLTDLGREVPASSVDATGPNPTPSNEISRAGIVDEEHTIADEGEPPEVTGSGGHLRATPDESRETSGQLVLLPTRARVEYAPHGARLVYEAIAGSNIPAIRAQLRSLADSFEEGCAWGRDPRPALDAP